MSVLSVKSAIIEDTGNYSCILPTTGESVTVMLNILKGEHFIAKEEPPGHKMVTQQAKLHSILSLVTL